MIILNDFIAEHEHTLDSYYSYLIEGSSSILTPVTVPSKYYSSSLEVLTHTASKITQKSSEDPDSNITNS